MGPLSWDGGRLAANRGMVHAAGRAAQVPVARGGGRPRARGGEHRGRTRAGLRCWCGQVPGMRAGMISMGKMGDGASRLAYMPGVIPVGKTRDTADSLAYMPGVILCGKVDWDGHHCRFCRFLMCGCGEIGDSWEVGACESARSRQKWQGGWQGKWQQRQRMWQQRQDLWQSRQWEWADICRFAGRRTGRTIPIGSLRSPLSLCPFARSVCPAADGSGGGRIAHGKNFYSSSIAHDGGVVGCGDTRAWVVVAAGVCECD